jgi:hypothetical protein
MSVANCSLRSHRKRKRDDGGRYRALRGNSELIENSGARSNDKRVAHRRIHLLPLGHIATHRHGIHYRGEPRARHLDGVVSFPPTRRCGMRLLESLIDCFGSLATPRIRMTVFALVVILSPCRFPFPCALGLWQEVSATLYPLYYRTPSPWC